MLLTETNLPLIVREIQSLQPDADEAILLLFAEDDVPDIPLLIQLLNAENISFFGGVFPGLLYGNQHIKKGCIVKKIKSRMQPFLVTQIASQQLIGLPERSNIQIPEHSAAIVLFDGLAPNLNDFLGKLNNAFGGNCDFIGGGAGSLTLQKTRCIFSSEGLVDDAAVVCVLNKKVRLGFRHGWEHLAGPLVATQTKKNILVQLNWQKAFDVYRDIVEKESGEQLTPDNFGAISFKYPFGILREKEEDIVRDPVAILERGAILCIGEIPTNAVLYIMKSTPEGLLEAVRKAVHDCMFAADNTPILVESTFVVDCISRTRFLAEYFEKEMSIVREGLTITNPEQEPYGVLGLGELASYGENLVESYNKTIVIGAFH